MYVSPTSEGDVRALLIPVVHTLSLLTSISAGRLPYDEFSRETRWKASSRPHTFTFSFRTAVSSLECVDDRLKTLHDSAIGSN